MSRWLRFILVLILGIGIGLLYGWVIDPVEYVDTYPDSLRQDYKTDYVLMVAEAYQAEGDLKLAVERLKFLGEAAPGVYVDNALYFAVQSGYATSDLGLLRTLSDALIAADAGQNGGQP